MLMQNIPTINGSRIDAVEKGAYMSISKEAEKVECILIATNSEVELTIRAKERLVGKIYIRVVSMPCMELYDMQVKEYYEEILPQNIDKKNLY